MKIEKKIGNKIRLLRLKEGLSQESFAALIGVHRTYIGMIERGERNITIQTLYKISKGLNIKIWMLLKELNI